jgi:NADP-dependent aldehyde dehydrogenase
MIATAIAAAAKETGMPAGVFSMVQGASHEVGLALVTHPMIEAVGFTGSFRGGKALFDAAVRRERPIPVYAEMGSTNPVFILPKALETRGDTIAQGLAQSVTLGVGQFCTNPGLVVTMPSAAAESFLRTTDKLITEHAGGTMLTQGIRSAYLAGTKKLSQFSGVEVRASGPSHPSDAGVGAMFFQTGAQVLINQPALTEEVFGPSTLLVTAQDKAELLEIARQMEGHLTATVHGTAAELVEYVDLLDLLALKVGRLVINGFPTGVEVGHAMNHGGPYPATTDVRSTSVGTAAIERFTRPLCYQDFPQALLPAALQDNNPQGIMRLYNGEWRR